MIVRNCATGHINVINYDKMTKLQDVYTALVENRLAYATKYSSSSILVHNQNKSTTNRKTIQSLVADKEML